MEKVRTAAAEVGVAQHAIHFKEAAESYHRRSWIWLIATGVLGALMVGFGIYNVHLYMTEALDISTAQAVQIGVAKLLIFSVLYFAFAWCGRVYKAQQHNYVVNRHRHNALSTFEAFVKAISDEQTKNAVLLQTTESIFAPQVSGFTAQEAEPATSPKVLEIIRSAMGAGGE